MLQGFNNYIEIGVSLSLANNIEPIARAFSYKNAWKSSIFGSFGSFGIATPKLAK